jgi:hypothetical protein
MTRRETEWWDTLEIPSSETDPFALLARTMPHAEEHDYVIYTDGAGCLKGWGANAAVIYCVESETYDIRVSANYGQTVQRNELSAMLDGLFAAVEHKVATFDISLLDEPPANPLAMLAGNDRATVLWYTDRQNLAKSLLFNERGDPLNKRTTERDLWMRYTYLAKHVCITPMHTSRNTVPLQGLCDTLCGIARAALMSAVPRISASVPVAVYGGWGEVRPQKAIL